MGWNAPIPQALKGLLGMIHEARMPDVTIMCWNAWIICSRKQQDILGFTSHRRNIPLPELSSSVPVGRSPFRCGWEVSVEGDVQRRGRECKQLRLERGDVRHLGSKVQRLFVQLWHQALSLLFWTRRRWLSPFPHLRFDSQLSVLMKIGKGV